MDIKVLMQLGLNESDVKVYFALLELDSSSVGKIYEKAGVADSKIYVILEKLKEKGLVSFVVKNNVKHFQASDPKNLLRLISEREVELKEQKKELKEEIIPEIERRREGQEEKHEATVFEGYEGLKSGDNLILETLKKGEEYQVFMLGEALENERLIRFFENYHKKRIEKRIKVRLVSEEKHRKTIKKWHMYRNMRIRFYNRKLPIGAFIFKNHVMTVVFGEKPSAFVIKAKKNYDYWKEFFEDVWSKSRS